MLVETNSRKTITTRGTAITVGCARQVLIAPLRETNLLQLNHLISLQRCITM